MNTQFKTLFYLKKPKNYKSGPLPVYLRITVGFAPKELSTGVQCLPSQWNSKTERLKDSKTGLSALNAQLDKLEIKAKDNFRYLSEMEPDGEITSQRIKDGILGKKIKTRTVLEIFREHNAKVRDLVGREFSPGTLERYETSLKHTADFIKSKYGCSDIALGRVNHVFVSEYDFYLRSVRKCNNNTTVKYMKNFKKIILICIASGYISVDPFLNYKPKLKPVNRKALTEDELKRIMEKDFSSERLTLVRDIFLFCCYTGLAYIDVKNLKRSELYKGIDGEVWIHTFRQKTETATKVPLLSVPYQLVKKYERHPKCEKVVFPVLSNQKMNAYLKEIADVCKIKTELSFHLARHTFATTVTLSNGVPIDTVSKMLGHTNLRTTQLYAKTLERKISEDMAALKLKLS